MQGSPGVLSGKESACQCKRHGVPSPIWEDPMSRGATKPKHHDYNLTLSSPGAHVSQLLKPAQLEPVLHSKRSHSETRALHLESRPPSLKLEKA